MRPKIVFVMSGNFPPRTVKRINDFISRGYEVCVNAFQREDALPNLPFSYNVVGTLDSRMSYIRRLPILMKGIKLVIKKYNNENNVLYYAFGLDCAMILMFYQHRHQYIFEESDLMHTYINNPIIRIGLERIDRLTIRKSLITVLTSEGFAKYHFGSFVPQNVCFIPNRLAKNVLECPTIAKNVQGVSHLSIGFVGRVRFRSILFFAKHILERYPQHNIHFFGSVSEEDVEKFKELESFPNCYFHGSYTTPIDLPQIYSQIDMVLSTYDTDFENVRYAEPNKFYESIYFETPIIVSQDTFLGEKVLKYNTGYVVNPYEKDSLYAFIDGLSDKDIQSKVRSIKELPKDFSINDTNSFFVSLERLTDNK